MNTSEPADEALTGGRTTWERARTTDLRDATCLWQDLDGLNVGPPPTQPPRTSLLWAWTTTGVLLRLRLDGQQVFLARWNGTSGHPALPWNPIDDRVVGYRGTERTHGGLATTYTEVTVSTHDQEGPISFIYPQNIKTSR